MNYELILQKAIEFATKAHEGQKRKDGKDYITHPIAVYGIVRAWEIERQSMDWINKDLFKLSFFISKFCALWHDLEDTKWNKREPEALDIFIKENKFEEYFDQFFKDSILSALHVLNKNNHKNYFEYILAAKCNRYAKVVKKADLIHNISDLEEGSLKDKYRLAKHILEN
jgi:(p)ppGpp synthase/HD superfamily hydrolase